MVTINTEFVTYNGVHNVDDGLHVPDAHLAIATGVSTTLLLT
jgi:hypothetical protein